MYYYLVSALKRRLILELQEVFSRHPVYRKVVPFIQGKHAFEERPEFGIIVTGSNASKVQLSPDNFMGTVQSHVMLAQVGKAQFPLEWVREDLACLRQNGGRMPTAPGIYYLEVLQAPDGAGDFGSFVIDPLFTVTDEPVIRFQSGLETKAYLQHLPLSPTVRLYQDRIYFLKEGIDYTLDGRDIQFLQSFPPTAVVTADYRYPGETIGPVNFCWNTSDTSTLPGVVLAFGKRAEENQKVAVVVYEDRVDAAEAFGGKSELSFELEILARDVGQAEELGDLTYMYLWSERKPVLEWEGIEVLDVSVSGESEEPIDETGEDFQYTTTVSVQLRADWEVHRPLPLVIAKVEPGLNQVASNFFYESNPVFAGRTPDYERIA